MRSLLILTILSLSATAASAQLSQTIETSYVIAPAQSIFLAVAAHPDCPLRIEDAQLLMPVGKGRPKYRYKLSNKGDKPIHYFTVVAWSAEGTGGTLGGPPPWDGRVTDRLLYPGESVRVGDYNLRIAPLDSILQQRLKLSGKLQTVVSLLVDQITFADGSKYDAQTASKALFEFFVERAN